MRRLVRFLIRFLLVVVIAAIIGAIWVHSTRNQQDSSTPDATQNPQETLEPVENMPMRTIDPVVIGGNPTQEPVKTPNPTNSNSSTTQSALEELPNIISDSAYRYNEMIKKVMKNPVENVSVYTEDGGYLEDACVYKYNDEYFVISKDRKGFIAEYNRALQRYEAKELLPNVDVHGAQTYFEAGFSLIHTDNTIEVWQLGEKKDLTKTEWGKYLKKLDSGYVGYCLGDTKFPYYFHVEDGKIYLFRFYAYGSEARVDGLYEIEAEYYVNYKDRVFYKEGSCVYIFDGFYSTKVAENVKSISYDKETYEPIISLEDGKTIYGDELL